MKYIFLFVLMLACSAAMSQTPPTNYTQLNSNYQWNLGRFKGFALPARDTSFLTGQWRIAGTIVYDSTISKGYIWTGAYWQEMGSGAGGGGGIGQVVAGNGLSNVNDSTVKLGGTYSDSITHRYLPVGAKTNQSTLATSYVDVISNRTLALDKDTSDWIYWLRRGANGLKWYNRQFYEHANDTADQQYNGVVNIFNRFTQDHSSTRYDSTLGKSTNMQYAGVYAINQLYPVKHVKISPSAFGRDGSNFAAALGFGKDSTYIISIQGNSTSAVPLTNFHSDVDFNRAVPSGKSRIFRGGGLGVTGYLAFWRSYQSSLGSADTLNPSYVSRVQDFYSLGSLYRQPFNGSGYTKTRILARSTVDTAIGFYSAPKYAVDNEVANGFGIYQEGAHDFNYMAGKLRIRGNAPNRPSVDTMSQEFEVYGNTLLQGSNNLRFRGSALGTFPGMYWLLAPDSAGSQASIDFNSNTDRDQRVLVFAAGTSGTATANYPATSGTGWRMEWRTGLNGANRMVYWRNGNFVVGSGSSNYMDISRLTVVGDMTVTDTVFLRKTPLITSGSGYDVLVRSRADSALYALPYDSVSSGGGSSVNLGNADLVQTDATRIYDANAGNLYFNNNAAFRVYGSGSYAGNRMIDFDGTANTAYFGPDVGTLDFGYDADSLMIRGLGLRTDTVNYGYVGLNKSNGRLVRMPAPAGGGSGSPGGSSGQVQYNNSSSFDGSTQYYSSASDRHAFWVSSPTYDFEVSTGDIMTFGADNNANTRTNNTDKRSKFGGAHYANAEEPVALMNHYASNGNNLLNIGGGLSTMNSANNIRLITGATSTTVSGTTKIEVTNSVANFNPDNLNFDFSVEGQSNANLLYADASTDRVGIGTNIPTHDLTVNGDVRITNVSNATTADSVLTVEDGVIKKAAYAVTASGTYTPTLTNVSNISSATANNMIYQRVGNQVSFSFVLTVTPTAGTTSTQVDFSLPIASNFASSTNLIATGTAIGSSGVTALANGDVANDRGHIEFISTNTSAHTVVITGHYSIL